MGYFNCLTNITNFVLFLFTGSTIKLYEVLVSPFGAQYCCTRYIFQRSNYLKDNSQAEQIIPQSQLFSSSAAKSGEILADIKDDVSNKINIYPNPADDEVTITIPDGEYDIVINTLQGSTQDVLPNHTGITKLNVSDYSAGIYIVKFNNGNKQIIKKLMIR